LRYKVRVRRWTYTVAYGELFYNSSCSFGASLPSHAFCFTSSGNFPAIFWLCFGEPRLRRKLRMFSCVKVPRCVTLIPFFCETATSAGKPKPRFSFSSNSNCAPPSDQKNWAGTPAAARAAVL